MGWGWNSFLFIQREVWEVVPGKNFYQPWEEGCLKGISESAPSFLQALIPMVTLAKPAEPCQYHSLPHFCGLSSHVVAAFTSKCCLLFSMADSSLSDLWHNISAHLPDSRMPEDMVPQSLSSLLGNCPSMHSNVRAVTVCQGLS